MRFVRNQVGLSGKPNLDANAVVVAQFGSVSVETTEELRWLCSNIRRKGDVINERSVQRRVVADTRCWQSPSGKRRFSFLINYAILAGLPPWWYLQIEVPKQYRSLLEARSCQDVVTQDIQIFAGAFPLVFFLGSPPFFISAIPMIRNAHAYEAKVCSFECGCSVDEASFR